MAVHYIPSAYQQRPRRTGWDMMLPQMAQALFGSMLQEKAWEKRFGTQQEATTKALGEQREYEKGIWKERYTGKPTSVKETGGLIFGGKYYAPTKASALMEKVGALALARGGPDKITPQDYQRLALGKIDWDLIQQTDAKGMIDPGGTQRYHMAGTDIPEGYKVVKTPAATINIGKASASERTAIVQSRSSIDSLQNIKSLFDKAYVGPVKGRIGKAKDVFGGNPERQSEFYAATAAFKNSIIKQITGAQMSEVEAKRIMKQIPDINDHPKVWNAKWRQSIKNVRFLYNRQLQILGQSGLKTPGGKPQQKKSSGSEAEEYLRSIGQ